MNRTNFRPRAIDPAKSMQIFKDINDIFKKEDTAGLNWVVNSHADSKAEANSLLQSEMKKIIDLFDKKKTIIIPKVEKFEKQSALAIPTQNSDGKFSTLTVNYKQSEFIRPRNYIVYSEKNRLEPKGKDYEATNYDINFLKFENNFISIEELEKIISALENDINKGEMIPIERVKEVVLSIIPDKKQYFEKINTYWSERRDVFKKSLLRKFWKDQKSTDKHLATTFRRRDREKMKTRRNKKNDIESLQKLRDIRDSSQKSLTNIIYAMKEREIAKKNQLLLLQLEFEMEVAMLKNEKISRDLEDRWKELSKAITKPAKLNIFTNANELKDEKEYHTGNNYGRENKKIREEVVHKGESLPLAGLSINIEQSSTKSMSNPEQHKKPKKIRRITNSEIAINPSVKPKNVQNVPEIKQKINKEIWIKHRIRKDFRNQLVVDRYIQRPHSMNPFDDSFSEILNKVDVQMMHLSNNKNKKARYEEEKDYCRSLTTGGHYNDCTNGGFYSPKAYKEDITRKKEAKFDLVYEEFLKGRYSKLIITSESDEDTNIVSNHVKSFSSSYKHFLKQKRSINEVISN